MLKTFKEVLRTGNATVAYPDAPLARPEYVRGKPEHDLGRCIACAACACACPPNAIQMEVSPPEGTITWSLNYGRCIFCGRCEEVCPVGAIGLSADFELAVSDRRDLEHVCTYPLQKCTECGRYYASAKEIAYAAAILLQDAPDENVLQTIGHLGSCPECRQKADAWRACKAVDEAGDPTPPPSAEELAESRRAAKRRREGGGHDIG